MKDPYLLPFLLPNVFEISKTLSPDAFKPVLIKLQPLFALRDPPQNMLSELRLSRTWHNLMYSATGAFDAV
jgi:SCY1-like protein 2